MAEIADIRGIIDLVYDGSQAINDDESPVTKVIHRKGIRTLIGMLTK